MSLVTLPYAETHGPIATPYEAPEDALDLRRRRPGEARSAEIDSRTWHRGSRRSAIGGHVVLVLLALFTVFPIVWMYLTSFRPPGDLFSSGLVAGSLSTANYSTAFAAIPVGVLLEHTVVVAVAVSLGQLLTSLLAAYAFARFRFKGRNLLFLVFIGSWLVPFQVTMLPNYVLVSRLGLLNSLAGIIVPQLSSAFAVLLLRQHLNGFPVELLEAARVEGQSVWATLWTVVVPNLGPALAALGILLFVGSWNEYFWPLLVYRAPDSVIQLGIQGFLSAATVNYGALMAASGLATLPIFAIYAVLQRRVVSAFVRSGLR
ncbi:MAG: carbohydrate transporter rane protein 2, family [Acidimicrobiaceae bacterium]|nr:carbohydrate transporter rane protein 2, family [Acidimicrobiaceae bacterium]